MRASRWIALLLLCLLGSCDSRGPALDTQPSLPLAALLPALPNERQPAEAFTKQVLGKDWFSRSSNTLSNGDALLLPSPTNGIAWGIWKLSPGLKSLESVEVVIGAASGNKIYFALSDYSRGVWQIEGPAAGGQILALDNARHKSPQGSFYVAVITSSFTVASVEKLVLETEFAWLVTTVDSTGNVGSYPSLAVVAGRPAISYCEKLEEGTDNSVKYARAGDPQGSTWGAPVVLSNYADRYGYTSLELVNGQPAISYHAEMFFPAIDSGGRLHYVRAADTTGSVWGPTRNVDTDPLNHDNLGAYNSLAVVDGRPAICYRSDMLHGLLYKRASDAEGTAWGPRQLLDGSENAGQYCSLVVDSSGLPYIAYYDAAGGNLMGIGTNPQGTAWNAPFYIDGSADDVGAWAASALVFDDLAVCYSNSSRAELKYARYSMLLQDWQLIVVDGSGGAGTHASLAVIAGNPAISYYDASGGDLKYVRALDANGSTWGIPERVDSFGNVGTFTSLAEVDGLAAISYYDEDKRDLKYAIRLGP
jgi:hypothetical protein